MPRNEELLRQVAQDIRDDPASYDQTTFARETSCGTTACIAGHAAIRSGKRPIFDFCDGTARYFFSDTERVCGGDIGQVLLGLTDEEASLLFDEFWRPAHGLSVPEALEKLAAGASIEEITGAHDGDCDCDACCDARHDMDDLG